MAEQLGVAKKPFNNELFEMIKILEEHPNLIQKIADSATPSTPGLFMILEVLGQLHSDEAHNILIDNIYLNQGNLFIQFSSDTLLAFVNTTFPHNAMQTLAFTLHPSLNLLNKVHALVKFPLESHLQMQVVLSLGAMMDHYIARWGTFYINNL